MNVNTVTISTDEYKDLIKAKESYVFTYNGFMDNYDYYSKGKFNQQVQDDIKRAKKLTDVYKKDYLEIKARLKKTELKAYRWKLSLFGFMIGILIAAFIDLI